MAGDDNKLRTKILKEINEDFHQGDKLNFALDSSDLLTELVNCFEEKDEVIRELAARTIIKVCGTESGRMIIVEDEIVPKIRGLFDDEVVEIRANGYKAMKNLAEFSYGIDNTITFNIITVLIDKLMQEKSEVILILILELMLILLEGGEASQVTQGSEILQHLNHHLVS